MAKQTKTQKKKTKTKDTAKKKLKTTELKELKQVTGGANDWAPGQRYSS
jgi:hypothetical protein